MNHDTLVALEDIDDKIDDIEFYLTQLKTAVDDLANSLEDED